MHLMITVRSNQVGQGDGLVPADLTSLDMGQLLPDLLYDQHARPVSVLFIPCSNFLSHVRQVLPEHGTL